MNPPRLPALILLLAVLGAVFSAPPAVADEFETLRLSSRRGLPAARSRISVRVLGTPGGNRHGGYGYATVELHSRSEAGATLRFVIHPGWGWRRSPKDFQQTLTQIHRLEPGESSTLNLPLVNSRNGNDMQITVIESGDSASVSLSGRRARRTGETAVLTVWPEDEARRVRWESHLATLAPKHVRGGNTLVVTQRSAGLLPDRWVLLSAFDLIVVDRQSAGLTAEQEGLLKRYVAGGGHLAILGMQAEAAGPLRDLLDGRAFSAGDASLTGMHGLGRWIALAPGRPESETPKRLDAWLRDTGRTGGYSVIGASQRRFSGSIPTPFWFPLEIPGLGQVPVKTFFFLLLLFAVVVGPLNYLYFRRRKRLPMLLVTIPVAGFACTLMILMYGWFSEGFGVIGSVRTFTVLDQRDHTAACCTARTLYAGLQPSSLTPDPESFFCSSSFPLDTGGGESGSTFRVSLDGGLRVDGGALPSRTPTPFVSVAVGRARERLRFRRRPGGGFDALAAPGFAPREEPGAVLLRTHDGAYYVMDAQGVLTPRSATGVLDAVWITKLVEPLFSMPMGAGEVDYDDGDYRRGYGRQYVTGERMAFISQGPEGLDKWLGARLQSLPKGSYLARMQQAPLTDDLGLDVAYRAARHIVLGLLAEEDIIDD